MVGLVLGKPIGIVLTTVLVTTLTPAKMSGNVSTRDLIGVGSLAGVGFTVSLLVTELSFDDPVDTNTARLAVIVASLIAIAVAAVFLVHKPERSTTAVLATLGDE